MNIVTNFPMHCIHINYISCKSITVYLKLEVLDSSRSFLILPVYSFSVEN